MADATSGTNTQPVAPGGIAANPPPPAQTPVPPAQPATPPPAAPTQQPPPQAPPTQPSERAFPPKDPNAPADPQQNPTGANASDNKAPTQAAVVPEKYDLKLPKDSLLAQSRLEKIAADARAQGLSNEQAQALVQRESEAASSYQTQLLDTWKQKQTEWVETSKADPEIGGERFKENAELAHRVIARYGSESLKTELNQTGYGNHPELLRFVVRLGRAMSEDQLVISEGRESPQQYKRYEDLYDHPTSPK